MRVVTVALCACILLGTSAAVAQLDHGTAETCHKGFFWPFSRQKGDCLTDAEIREGKTGVYGDPNAKAAAPGASPASAAAQSPPAPAQNAAAPAPVRNPAAPAANPQPAPAQAATASPPPVQAGSNNVVACHKGTLWPFSRQKGDCLTDAEIREGKTGVYGDPNAKVGAPAENASAAAAPGDTLVECHKGTLWPFSRQKGDCLTDAEIREGKTGVYGDPNAKVGAPARNVAAPAPARNTAAPVPNTPTPTSPAPAPAQTARSSPPPTETGSNNVAECHKGFFWPFSREKGDCLTDAEIREGKTGVYGDPNAKVGAPARNVAAPAPARNTAAPIPNTPTPAPPAPAPAQTARSSPPPAQTGNNVAECHKGFFWPFSREKGDCLTDAEIREGKTGVYGDPNVKVGAPAPASTAAAPPPASTAAAPPPASTAAAPAPSATPPAPTQAASERAPVPNPGPGRPAAPAAGGGSTFFGLFGSNSRDQEPGLLSDNPAFVNARVAATPAAAPVAPAAPAVAVQAPPPAQRPAAEAAAETRPAANPAPPTAAADRDAVITRTDANGAPCTKGIFWPFSREKGDCLTDVEKKDGLTGNYLDPTAGRAAPARVVAAPPVAPSPPPVAPVSPPAAPRVAAQAPPPTPAPVAVANVETRPAANPAPPPAPADRDAVITRTDANGAKCTKGIFWPFSREKGDCLTDAEKKNGQTGNYLDPSAGAAPPARNVSAPPPRPAPAPSAPAATAQAPSQAPVAVANVGPPPANTPAPAATNRDAVITGTDANGAKCTKGFFWPFARSKGDCLTDAEKKNGLTGNYQEPAGSPASVAAPERAPAGAVAVSTNADAPPANNAPATSAVITKTDNNGTKCTKGILWPFVREAGDCPTDAEKKDAATKNGGGAQ